MATWSLVTVTYNSGSRIEEFWRGVELDSTTEWIVVDNGSHDNSVDVAESMGARVIRSPRNLGFGGANNLGFRSSGGDYVAFVNPDATPVVADLPLLADAIERYDRVLVAPQLRNPNGTLQPNGRGAPRLMDKVLNRIAPERVAGSYTYTAERGQVLEVDWLIGAVVAGGREWLAELGPWDERFFVYYEDTDLGLRNAAVGGRSLVLGDANWTHGWARETAKLDLGAWKREISSLTKFYARYPRLLIGLPR